MTRKRSRSFRFNAFSRKLSVGLVGIFKDCSAGYKVVNGTKFTLQVYLDGEKLILKNGQNWPNFPIFGVELTLFWSKACRQNNPKTGGCPTRHLSSPDRHRRLLLNGTRITWWTHVADIFDIVVASAEFASLKPKHEACYFICRHLYRVYFTCDELSPSNSFVW